MSATHLALAASIACVGGFTAGFAIHHSNPVARQRAGLGQHAFDRQMRQLNAQPLDNDETPDFGTPSSPRCTDAWALIGDTTVYLCSDGRVTTS